MEREFRLLARDEEVWTDTFRMATGIRAMIEVVLSSVVSSTVVSVSVASIQRDILEFIARKRLNGITSAVVFKSRMAVQWSSEEELVWKNWIWHTFTESLWDTYVIEPVFGEDTRLWEVPIDGWRSLLHSYMDEWIVRSMDLLNEIYPELEEEEDSGDEFNAHAFTGKSRNFN